MACKTFLTLISLAGGQFSAPHEQVCFLHCDLQPTERAIQPSHQQALSKSVPTVGRLVEHPQAEGLSPAKSSDPGTLVLHVTERS